MVREFTEACRAEGMKCGLYYSPAQWGSHAVEFKDGREYDDYFIGQITELLSDYGKIDYIWFDGCGSNGHSYDQKRIVGEIRRLQPDILIFDMWDPDTRWVGNEDGYAPFPNLYEKEMNVLGQTRPVFAPAECDCKLRESWFYDHNEDTIKSVEELLGMYELSVGRGCNFLLNVGPDSRGLIHEADLKRLEEFGEALNELYRAPLPFEAPVCADGMLRIAYSDETQRSLGQNIRIPPVKRVVLGEDVSQGQCVRRFRLYAHIPSINPICATRFCVFDGTTIGHKLIIRLPDIRSAMFDLEIIESDGEARISEFKAY